MMREEEDELALSPVNFFAVECPLHEVKDPRKWVDSKHLLPDLSLLTGEETFAKVYGGWDTKGLYFSFHVESGIEEVLFPNPERGDSIELFIDTRNVKTAGFNHRFCHHFCFLPEPVEGVQAKEITHFRTEDKHPLTSSDELQVEVKKKKTQYQLTVFIPQECLHGYDPAECDRLGWTYRINRFQKEPQHFSLLSSEFPIDQQPSQWSTLKLV